jgi:hypothetical protein
MFFALRELGDDDESCEYRKCCSWQRVDGIDVIFKQHLPNVKDQGADK